MPPQIKRTDAGTGAIIDQDFLGEEIDTNFLGDEIPRDQWRQDDNGNIIIDPAPVENFLGPELTASGDLKYEDGVFTFEGFKEWEAKEREEGRDGFWHWLTVTLPEGSKDAFSYLYEGGKELPEKFKEDPLKATAIFPEAALSAAEGYKDIATGAIDLVQRPFRSEQENERARYERYKLFADRSKRILEDRKSRVGDAIRAAGYLLDSDLEDYASAYDEGINPASADTLSIILDPAALFGGSLYRTAGRVVGKPAVAANKALNNAIKGVNQGTFKKVLDVAKETAKRPATQFTKGVGKTVDLTGKGIEFVGQKIVDAGQQGRMLQSFPQLAKGVGEAVKLKGGAIGTPGQILSVASEAAQKAGRRQTGLGLVKKKGTLRAPIQKAVQILDTPLSDRLLRNAGDLADKITKGTAIGIGTGYVAGGAEGAAAGGGFGAFGGGVGFGAEKAAKYTPLVRNKFKGMERLKLDEEFITDYAARLPEAERKGFLNPDRRMSVSDLAAEADAAQLFQGYLRKEGANVGIKYVDGEGMVKALSRDPENPNVNARYQYGAYDKNSNTIFINTDSSGTGRNRTLFHELFHPTEYFSAPREKTRGRDKGEQVDPFGETRAELEQTLFGTFDGAGNQITKGMYNKKQMLDFENQYLDAVFQQNPTSPLGRKIAEARKLRDQAIKDNDTEAIDKITFLLGQYELQKRQNRKAKENYLKGDVATRRKNITSEILSEHFANFGEEAHFGLLRKAKDVLQRDRFSKNTLSNKLAKLSLSTLGGMRRMLEGKGVTFDAAGNPKGDFKAESGIFVDPLTGENLITTPEVEHLLAQYVVSLDKFNNRLIIDKTGFNTVETASSLKDTKRSELTPEREKQLREIGWLEDFDAEDNPIFSTARNRNKKHREEVAKVIDILNANPDDTGEPKMWRKTKTKAGRDRWEAGVPSEKQMQALRNSDLDPSYVEKIEKIRNAILKGDGTIWGNDYYKAITGGKYDSRAKVKFSLIVPFALEATQAGNINIKAFNLSKLEQKIGNYADQRPAFFDAWNGDTDAFRRDIVDFFQGPNRGKLFPEGDRKDLIYQFLGIKNKQNPLSGEWVDNSRLIESNRIERSTNLNPYENLDKIPFDYGKALRREYMPEPNQQQGARFMPPPAPTTPQFKRFFEGSKVVDDKGEPLVVYRGTVKKPKPDRFRTRLGRSTPTFTSVPEVASLYSHKEGFSGPEPKGSVFPVYLSIKQPYDVRDVGARATLNDFIAGRAEAGKGDQGDYFEAGDIIEILEGFEELRTPENIEVDAEGYASMFRNQTVSDVVSDINKALEDVDKGVFSDTFGTEKVGKELAQEYFDDWLSTTLDGIELDAYHLADNPAFVDVIKRSGYDGIIHTDTIELGAPYFTKESVAGRPIDEVDLDPTPEQSQISEEAEHTTYRPFKNNQVKSVLNKGDFNPESPDIRFMPAPAEGENMVAVHNLSADNLRHSLKMGGIANPSMAILDVNKGGGFDSYGDITLVASKELIDPKKGAKVFGADIYSPRYPDITVMMPKETQNKIEKYLEPHQTINGKNVERSSIWDLAPNLETEGWKRSAQEHTGLQSAYLKEKGLMPKIPEGENASYVIGETVRENFNDFSKWVEDLPEREGWQFEEKIFRGFTPAGNRRYTPHTLDNVVKIMKRNIRGGENFNYGSGSVRAKVAPQFRSVAQIKKNRGKLTDPRSMERVKNEVNADLNLLADEFEPHLKFQKDYLDLGLFTEHLQEAAERGTRSLRAYYEEGAPFEKVAGFLNKLKDLPTDYFEAKFPRAVQLEEFEAAIIPEDLDPKLKKVLEDRGLELREYDVEQADIFPTSRKGVLQKQTEEAGLRFMPQPTFYSKAERAVEGAKAGIFNKEGMTSVGQAKALLEKNAPETELEWSGVLDYLDLQKEEGNKVSKQDLLSYLKNNGVEVEEVLRSSIGAKLEAVEKSNVPDTLNNIYEIYRADDPEGDIYGSLGQLTEAAPEVTPSGKTNLPVRRILAKYGADRPFTLRLSAKNDTLTFKTLEEADQYIQGVVSETLFAPTEKFAGGPAALPGGENYSELVLKLPERSPEDTFYVPSGHRFPEQNILAHIRFTERTDADGKRMLFLDEVQSDWNSEGRERGFDKKRPDRVQEEIDRLNLDIADIRNKRAQFYGEDYIKYRDLTEEAFESKLDRMQELLEEYPDERRGVPDMPYKGSKWQDLVMKRMIRWAADNGYDRLGWITGKDTADRYDLSKVINEIAIPTVNENSRAIRLETGKGDSFKMMVDNEGKVDGAFKASQFNGKQLDEVIGKELAEKVMAFESPGSLTGTDLKVGGEWASNLYDKSLPKIARKLTKKKGAVGRVGIFGSSSKLNDALAKNGIKPKYEANYVDISPEVKELAQEGFSYFMPEGRGGTASAPVQTAAPQPPSGVIIPKVKLTEDEKEESRKLLQSLER